MVERRRRFLVAAAVQVAALVLLLQGAPFLADHAGASPSSPKAAPGPGESLDPGRLRLEIERHVDELLGGRGDGSMPRFETSVEVVSPAPQAMLERYFRGADLECGPVEGGAPTVAEMRQVWGAPTPYVDVLGLLQALGERLRGEGARRYFLYRITKQGDVRYSLRTERVPAAWLHGLVGASYELLESFADVKRAARAFGRMERGFGSSSPASDAPPPALWMTRNCRPSHDRRVE